MEQQTQVDINVVKKEVNKLSDFALTNNKEQRTKYLSLNEKDRLTDIHLEHLEQDSPSRVYYLPTITEEIAKKSLIPHSNFMQENAGKRVFFTHTVLIANGKGKEFEKSSCISTITITFPRLADRFKGCNSFELNCVKQIYHSQIEYFHNSKKLYPNDFLDEEGYYNESYRRLWLLIEAGILEKKDVLILPLLGQGAYTRCLSPDDQKCAANAMLKALKAVLQKRSTVLKDNEIMPYIFLSIPMGGDFPGSEKMQNEYYTLANDIFQKDTENLIQVTRKDVLEIANTCERLGAKVSLTIPGGHSNFGGGYTDVKVAALEEQIYTYTTMPWSLDGPRTYVKINSNPEENITPVSATAITDINEQQIEAPPAAQEDTVIQKSEEYTTLSSSGHLFWNEQNNYYKNELPNIANSCGNKNLVQPKN